MLINFLVLFGVSTVFTFTFVFLKIEEKTITPITIMAGRCIIAFFLLFSIALITKKDLFGNLKDWWKFLTFATFGITLSWVGLAVGQEGTSVGVAAVLDAVIPIATFVIMVLILREIPFTFTGFLGLLIGVIGIVLVVGINKLAAADATVKGVSILVAAYVTFAANGVLVEKWAKGIDPLVTTTYFLFFASIMLGALALIFESPDHLPWTTDNYIEELLLGLFCTGAGYYGYYFLVYKAGAYFSSFIFFLLPVMGMLAGILILKEDFTYLRLLGVPIVLAGVYLVNREKFKKV
ncbi:MAG: membrane protein [Thermodesulfobacteriota bacterium]|nr:MAG: membrane protein [Thermodesulfobacteriota bacterium]